jgi:hypothetical protein
MSWIPTAALVPRAGRFASATLVDAHHPARGAVEAFIAQVYRERYGASLQSFLPHLLAYHDADGQLVAAVGLRLGDEGPLFVEQYLDAPAQHLIRARRLADDLQRHDLAEVGNFAALSPGTARDLIVQLTCTLHAARVRWVLFAATRQLRNAFHRLQLSPLELAEASPDRLQGDASDWGSYYAAQPRVMCGNVASGHAYLMRRTEAAGAPATASCPDLCLAGAL